jgi:2-(3-amino-3-carboxypropyl)histidine synthase
MEVAKAEVPVRKRVVNRVPDSISQNPDLIAACSVLPPNYNFEIPKTLWRIKETGARCVGLQMPEGLLMFATTIADVVSEFAGVEVVIMGDVTYGACCVDDFTAGRVGVDFLVHYGHSCLVPVDVTSVNGVTVMYVFVDVAFDVGHLVDCVVENFSTGPNDGEESVVGLASTVQFLTSLHALAAELAARGVKAKFLHSRPLSKGEVLGCTAAKADGDVTALLYVGDGR